MTPVIERVSVKVAAAMRDNGSFVAVHGERKTGWYGPVTVEIGNYVERVLSNALSGEPIMDHQRLAAKLRSAIGGDTTAVASSAVGAVDCATWDLHGLLVHAPVKNLLAPSPTSATLLYASWLGLDISSHTPVGHIEDIRRGGWQFTKWGLRSHLSHDSGAEAARLSTAANAVAAVLGEAAAFDAVFTWDLALTELFAERMSSANLLWLEDPLPYFEVNAYRSLASKAPLAIGERLFLHTDEQSLLELEPRAFTLDVVACGGLTQAVALVAAANARGISVYPHGRAFVPALHLAAAHPEAIPAVEYRLQWEPVQQQAYARPWVPERGMISIPNTPGLGTAPRSV